LRLQRYALFMELPNFLQTFFELFQKS